MKPCSQCPNPIKCVSLAWCRFKKESQSSKAKRGRIQLAIPEETKKMYNRDSWRCINCGNIHSLTPHHIFYKSDERIYDETRNTADRMVTLCIKCHRLLTDGDHIIDRVARDYLSSITK